MAKVGRNEICPCGSGKKYKRCHGFAGVHVPVEDKRPRIEKFGHVKKTMSVDFHGHKIVAVGDQLHYSKKWTTFPDFLNDYLKNVFGKEWWEAGFKILEAEQHPIIRWAREKYAYLKAMEPLTRGPIYSAVPNGPTMAYNSLAYDLYILKSELKLQRSLVERMKHKDQFDGARYEALVAAALLRAGMKFEFEDETDTSQKHPEFHVLDIPGGSLFVVEAKSRNRHHPNVSEEEIKLGIRGLLKSAFSKFDNRTLVIFVNLNVPSLSRDFREKGWFKELMDSIQLEAPKTEKGEDIFALIVCTNFPVEYAPNSPVGLQTYYCIPLSPLRRISDSTIARLQNALANYSKIPNSFEE